MWLTNTHNLNIEKIKQINKHAVSVRNLELQAAVEPVHPPIAVYVESCVELCRHPPFGVIANGRGEERVWARESTKHESLANNVSQTNK